MAMEMAMHSFYGGIVEAPNLQSLLQVLHPGPLSQTTVQSSDQC
jgi:hypothetical protein